MHFFLTGATGYIGSAVARALLAEGHTVTGLARSEESASKLTAAGIQPHAGNLGEPASIAAAANRSDGVIHAAMEWGPDAAQRDGAAVNAVLDALAGTGKALIYTSGVWVYGSTGGRVAGESAPLRPPAIVAWRPAVERRVLDAVERKVRAIVIRPAYVYGRGGGLVAGMVGEAREKGVVRCVGDGENHMSFVHVDDLANLCLRALHQAAPGDVFVAAAGPAFRARDVAEAASRAGGAEGRVQLWPIEEARKELGPLADALALDQKIGSTKAGRVLGWIPKSPSVLEDLRSPAQS